MYIDKFDKKLSFTKLYNFLKFNKQYIWNRHIPESSCLCEVCENVCLFAKGINKSLKLKLPTNPHDLIELCYCDSGQSECMDSSCDCCSIPRSGTTVIPAKVRLLAMIHQKSKGSLHSIGWESRKEPRSSASHCMRKMLGIPGVT